MNNITADYSFSPEELGRVLPVLVEERQPTFIWGAPGVGKSDIAKQVAVKTGREYLDIRALLFDPVDLRGVPRVDENGRTRWATPSLWPDQDSDQKYMINLEELTAAPPMTQAALYQLVLDRRLSEYQLPDGASIVACGNRESDFTASRRMDTALSSRFVHIMLEPDVDEWKDWATSADIAPEVLFYINMMPQNLHVFDPRSEMQAKNPAFPCPRTWEFVSRMVKANHDWTSQDEHKIYAGTVGEVAAADFCAFLRVWRDMPPPQAVFMDPEGVEIPEKTDALLALCGALYRMVDDTNFDALVQFANRLHIEIGEFLVHSSATRNKDLQSTLAFNRWVTNNR